MGEEVRIMIDLYQKILAMARNPEELKVLMQMAASDRKPMEGRLPTGYNGNARALKPNPRMR